MVIKTIPIKRSMAMSPLSPRKRLRPLAKKIIIPEQNQAVIKAISYSNQRSGSRFIINNTAAHADGPAT